MIVLYLWLVNQYYSLFGTERETYWFRGISGRLNGANSCICNTVINGCRSPERLPYPTILDNTEGDAAFADLEIPCGVQTIADFGGGGTMRTQYPGVKLFVLDPFNLPYAHNWASQQEIIAAGGVDVATAMSVLNIIPTLFERIRLITTMHNSLRYGGLAIFKVWAGSWPVRGSGKSTVDARRQVYQANKWADAFVDEVAAVFGSCNVFADNNRNMIVAKKQSKNIE